MKTLFIDTHSEKVIMTVIDGEKIYTEEKVSDRSHSEIAIPTLQKLLDENEYTLKDMDQIVVVNGPGSFTGVRIGVTIAKTIAYSLNIPIKTITSLELYGISELDYFDLITVEDSKGVYCVKKTVDNFEEPVYMSKSEFSKNVLDNNFVVSASRLIDYIKLLAYLKDSEPVNPHKVNPVYIKQIEVLK